MTPGLMKDRVILQGRMKERTEEQSSMTSSAKTPSIDDSSDQSQNPTSFQYKPLEPSDTSIRLIVLEPRQEGHEEIRCRMLYTTFGAKPNQIQLMPFIYKRAEIVVVWLGGYFEKKIDPRQSQYWHRLWVIQEVAKARRLKVSWVVTPHLFQKQSYTLQESGWDEFTSEFRGDRIRKFERLREERYSDSSLLRNLLKDHQSAQCKDPRDKIYGLVGLSTDCSGRLPMDYRKSLWGVYKDVISVYHGYPEILELSRLPKHLIGGPERVLARDLQGDEVLEYSLDLDPADPTTVKMPACFLGTIIHVGPTYNDIMSVPQKGNEWEAAVEQKVNDRKPEKREQSDFFLEALENTDEKVLKAILSLNRKTSWPQQGNDGKRVHKVLNSEINPEPVEVEYCPAVSLFLVYDENNVSPENAMGICCEGAGIGDFVFRVPNFALAIIVRRHLGPPASWKLVGYAGVAQTAQSYRRRRGLQQESKLSFNFVKTEPSADFKLCLDMPTLYRMSD
ncbi:hypothetical protein N431DRAFT_555734 [Stipitochalara longipes BDJ]|nr:hypothetical protein N431DRAFT_555734 [Stipitochalara longipes BDJ]